jgi:hypothetical protein
MVMMMHILNMHHLLVEEILVAEGLKVLEAVLVQVVLELKKHFNYG